MNRVVRWRRVAATAFIIAGSAATVHGSDSTSGRGALAGRVVEAETGEPVGWAVVLVEGLDRTRHSDADGHFLFPSLPSGVHVLQTLRVGYHDARFRAAVAAGDTVHIVLPIGHEPVVLETVVVAGEQGRQISPLQEPEVVFSGSKLRQNLGRTIGETVDSEPGIAQRSMGPAPSRPVLRGLSGDRLLVLEEGERTGDLSATSSDHAVAIEPMTTERIEVIRGPETLLYGSNALGGVVNVVRGAIPSTAPTSIGGSWQWQGETVNGGLSSGVAVSLPIGPLAMRIDGSLRDAGDIATPRGTLANTDIQTANTSTGVSWIRPWGFVGVAGSLYDSRYGIPPDPVAGHPGGVNIDLTRQHLEARGEALRGGGFIRRLEAHHSFSRYRHGEFEVSGALGLEFGLLTHNGGLQAHLSPRGRFENGVVGLWYEYRNYASAGLNFTPPAEEYAGALLSYHEWTSESWDFDGALRFDVRRVEPREERDSSTVGRIETRDFAGLSGGLSCQYRPSAGLAVGVTAMQTFRAPGVEDLYSEGPHLAAYAYEVGNGTLGRERGRGLELFVDYHEDEGSLHLAFFRNQIDGFTFARNTGERSVRRADLFLYQMAGESVLMHGAEASLDWHLARRWRAAGSVSYVRGILTDLNDEPLPRLPPLQGRLGVEYEAAGSVSTGLSLRLSADQNDPGRFEEPTDSYAVIDWTGEFHGHRWGLLHTLTLTIENLDDSVYRRHLNRVKEVMPEPGRNIRLLHRAYY